MHKQSDSKLLKAKKNFNKINKRIQPFIVKKKAVTNTTAGKWHKTDNLNIAS